MRSFEITTMVTEMSSKPLNALAFSARTEHCFGAALEVQNQVVSEHAIKINHENF